MPEHRRLPDYRLPENTLEKLVQAGFVPTSRLSLTRAVAMRCIACYARRDEVVSAGDIEACSMMERSATGHMIGALADAGVLVHPREVPSPDNPGARPRLYYQVSPEAAVALQDVPPLSICAVRDTR